ncbi:MAG: B12-binding domain-containing radical SAM protein [Desulfatibacillum sp.]|nr:B12-binding domain-containing radical SAM protein [Desulfatibacillum sp.]
MKSSHPHILGLNPWIHDFAAYDVWARPLGLYYLLAILRQAGYSVSYYDCLGRPNPTHLRKERYGAGPYPKQAIPMPTMLWDVNRTFSRYGLAPERALQDLKAMTKPDLVLVTSLMAYWYPGVFETIALAKQVWPDAPVVLGGAYATLWTEHAQKLSGADEVVPGLADTTVADLANRYTGLNAKNPVESPAPDNFPYPALDLEGSPVFAPILTSRGCPYRCQYCASGYLNPDFLRRSPDRIFDEMLHWHKKFGIRDFVFYDDAMLVQPETYILPLLDKVMSQGLEWRFHTPNAVHIRHLTPRVTKALFEAGFKTIRLGLETAVFSERKGMDAKLTKQEFQEGARHLREAGFDNKAVGAYLLVGLPNQDYNAVRESIQIVKESGIRPVLTHYTPIPHTALWEEARASSRYDLEADPLFTNRAVFPCQKEPFSWKHLSDLKKLCLS